MSEDRFILAAATLSRAAPREWQEFMDAFKAYSDRRRDDCVKSPPDMIYVAQGRAQQCNTLLEQLGECRKTAERITMKGKR